MLRRQPSRNFSTLNLKHNFRVLIEMEIWKNKTHKQSWGGHYREIFQLYTLTSSS